MRGIPAALCPVCRGTPKSEPDAPLGRAVGPWRGPERRRAGNQNWAGSNWVEPGCSTLPPPRPGAGLSVKAGDTQPRARAYLQSASVLPTSGTAAAVLCRLGSALHPEPSCGSCPFSSFRTCGREGPESARMSPPLGRDSADDRMRDNAVPIRTSHGKMTRYLCGSGSHIVVAARCPCWRDS